MTASRVVLAALAIANGADARNSLARTPPMGWMSWELFRCNVDCASDPKNCIGEVMYKEQVDALSGGGFTSAGYTGIHMDDCWEEKVPGRDPRTGELRPNATRFPSGMAALGKYMHSHGATFGLYTAESPSTCGGYPGSALHEAVDAKTFASWGVDYMKVDGCGPAQYYKGGYKAMGDALEASGRDIVYSCSWPAYIGSNETEKPFSEFIMDGCNLWRNWDDIQCNWGSLSSIIEHWGEWGHVLAPFAGPGHWHDMDMLLIGAHCVSEDEERTQMAIWSINAAPLIMGNDLRNVSDASKKILLNPAAIAVSQDPLGQMGLRLTSSQTVGQDPLASQVWARHLADGSVAVALYNKGGAALPPIPTAPCPQWNETSGGYLEACGGAAGDLGTFTGLSLTQAKDKCCESAECAGFSFDSSSGSGYLKRNQRCGLVSNAAYDGYSKPSQVPSPATADITVKFSNLNLFGSVEVYDIWGQKSLGNTTEGYTAHEVAFHGTSFIRLTPVK